MYDGNKPPAMCDLLPQNSHAQTLLNFSFKGAPYFSAYDV